MNSEGSLLVVHKIHNYHMQAERDVVAQSRSKGISCSETFHPRGSLLVTKTEEYRG